MSDQQLYYIFGQLIKISSVFTAFPLALAVYGWRRLSPALKFLGIYLLASGLTELTSLIIIYNGQSNSYMLHYFVVAEYALLSLVFYHTFQNQVLKRVILASLPVFAAFALLIALYVQPLTQLNSVPIVVESVLLLGYVLLYFRKIYKEVNIPRLEAEPMFWVAAAVLIYFSSTVFLFALDDFFRNQSPFYHFLSWGVHAIINIIFNALFFLALWVRLTRK